MKRVFWIAAGAILLLGVLFAGAVVGGALVYLGLRSGSVQSALAAVLPQAKANDQGLLVSGVEPGSPAEQAGLVRGDIITQVGGQAINTIADLSAQLKDMSAGDTLQLTVLHGDEIRTLQVTLGQRDDGSPYLGVLTCGPGGRSFSELPGDHFIVPFPGKAGVQVTEVVAGGPAEKAGLQAGDTITAANGQDLAPATDLAGIVHALKPGDTLTLTVTRQGQDQPLEISVTLGENPDQAGQAYLGIYYRPAGPTQWPGEGRTPFLPGTVLPEGINQAALVQTVVSGSPAAEAGLVKGDLITEVDGQALDSPTALADQVHAHQPGDVITLTVYSAGAADAHQVKVTLGEDPNQAGQAYLGVQTHGFFKFHQELPTTP